MNNEERKLMYEKGFVVFDFEGREWVVPVENMRSQLWLVGEDKKFLSLIWDMYGEPPSVVKYVILKLGQARELPIDSLVGNLKACAAWPIEVHEAMSDKNAPVFIIHEPLLVKKSLGAADELIGGLSDLLA